MTLFSRRRKSLNRQFPYIVEALADLPAGTVVDGEVVAIDESGRPDFNLLQHFRAESSRIQYYIFDLLCWKDRDLTRLPLIERRALLKSLVALRDNRIKISDYIEAAPEDLLSAVREQGLEGIIGKRKDSLYQPGERSGAWIKYLVNRGQEFVIGGYFPGAHSLIVGYYDGDKLTAEGGRQTPHVVVVGGRSRKTQYSLYRIRMLKPDFRMKPVRGSSSAVASREGHNVINKPRIVPRNLLYIAPDIEAKNNENLTQAKPNGRLKRRLRRRRGPLK